MHVIVQQKHVQPELCRNCYKIQHLNQSNENYESETSTANTKFSSKIATLATNGSTSKSV